MVDLMSVDLLRQASADGSTPILDVMRRGVIFDGDDTLWLTECLYDSARDEAQAVVEGAGLPGDRWASVQRSRDLANVKRLGHDRSRFPTSCVEAYDAVVAELGGARSLELRSAIWNAAAGVFDQPAPLREEAPRVLLELSRLGLRLALLTKGDQHVQKRRIEQSGLQSFFDVVDIVATKVPSDFRRVAAQLGLEPGEVVSVGNSVRSDAIPSIKAGVKAFMIPAHVWEFERSHDHVKADGIVEIESLNELPALVVG